MSENKYTSTKEPHNRSIFIECDGNTVCKITFSETFKGLPTESEADKYALQICEAFNVANRTGLTPLELEKALNKAVELFKRARGVIGSLTDNSKENYKHEIIKSEIDSFLTKQKTK